MPHRRPGAPTADQQPYLGGKPIRYYRPRGSRELRRLVDEGFQAFNAGRLSEACHVFTERMLDPGPRHDDRVDHGRGVDAGRSRRLRHRADGAGAGGLSRQHRRQPVPRSAPCPELHAAPRLAVPRRRRAARARDHPHLRRPVPRGRPARDRRLPARLPLAPGVRRARLVGRAALPARPRPAGAEPGLRRALAGGQGGLGRRARLHLVAWRQLDRHEPRLRRAAQRGPLHGRPEPGTSTRCAPSFSRARRTVA